MGIPPGPPPSKLGRRHSQFEPVTCARPTAKNLRSMPLFLGHAREAGASLFARATPRAILRGPRRDGRPYHPQIFARQAPSRRSMGWPPEKPKALCPAKFSRSFLTPGDKHDWRTHGELPPLGQEGGTQRRAIHHGGGSQSVCLRQRLRAERMRTRSHDQATGATSSLFSPRVMSRPGRRIVPRCGIPPRHAKPALIR